jgi:hypothetical protein
MAEVPEASARRYANSFPQFIISKRNRRKHLVLSSCEKTLKKVYELFGKGLGKDAVEKELTKEFAATIELEKEPTPILKNESVSSDAISLNDNALSVLTKLANSFEQMAMNQKATLELLREQNNYLMRKVELLQAIGSGNKTSHNDALKMINDMKKLGYGKMKIANKLNEDGVSTITGRGKWSTSTIARLMKEQS